MSTPEPRTDTVMLGYLHGDTVSHSWHMSLISLLQHDLQGDQALARGGFLAMRCGSGGLVAGRNDVVTQFLASGADWLFWLDTDMGFRPDTLDRLLAVADPVSAPVVGALTFMSREYAIDGMGGYRVDPMPCLFQWGRKPDGREGFTAWRDYPRDQLVRVAGTGSACLLIHRDALARVAAEYGQRWYDRVRPNNGDLLSEDLSLCARFAAIGVPIHVHTGIPTTHHKPRWLGEHDYPRLPPPATERVAVLVPVLGRPEHAEPFMASLVATAGAHATVYALVGGEDTAEDHQAVTQAWRETGAQVIEGGGVTFAEKVNYGYQVTGSGAYPDPEPWLLLVGSDVRFHPGWLDHALAAAGDRYHVVGTNDLGSPRTRTGQHSPHPLIRRSYVDEIGASWDGPGVLAHEGYRHNYVDDEIVTVAKRRGVWTAAPDSVIEHRHPVFGTGEADAVYARGAESAQADGELFQARTKLGDRNNDQVTAGVR